MSEKKDSGQLPDGSAEPSPAAADANAIWNDVVSPVTKPEESEKALEDAGSGKEDMFEDCPDDILVDDVERLRAQLDTAVAEKESSALLFEKEREAFVREVGALRIQLRGLSDEQTLVGENGGGLSYEAASGENGEKAVVAEKDAPWIELIKECSGSVKKALEKQAQIEARVRELDGVVCMKDQEIEGLNANVKFLSEGHHEKDAYFDALANRMLASLSGVVGQPELRDDTIAGKLVHVENGNFMLIENYNRMLSEIEQFRQCLAETGLDYSSQEVGGIFAAARDELLELRRKEAEFVERSNHLEDGNRKLAEELDKQRAIGERVNAELNQTRMELEQEKNRCTNTREKLTIAVQKGKGLVQQRDSLKHSIAEKMSELEKCRIELQEKSNALEAAELSKEELVRSENSIAALQETLSENNLKLQKLEEMLFQTGVPEDLQSMDIVERLRWLVDESVKLKEISMEFQTLKEAMYGLGLPEVILSSSLGSQVNWLWESYSQANEEVLVLRNEITATKEVAHKNIDQLTESLSAESQAKEHLQAELDNITLEYNDIIKKEHQVSLEKSQMVRTLLDASGIVMADEDVSQLSADIATLIDTCIGKIKEQSSASVSADMQAKEVLQAEVASLTSKYEEVVGKESQVSSENAEMVKMLLDVSGIVMDNEDVSQISSDIGTFVNTCIGKIKEQSSASFEQLNALISAEMQAKEYLQVELDNLTLKYKEIVEKERQVSSEKAEMVKYLLDVSGIMTDSEDVYQLSPDIATLVDRCAQKIKEQSSASVSADMQANEVLQAELNSLTSKYKEIVEKESQVSTVNAEMVKMLLDVSGIEMDNEDVAQISSDIGTFVSTCIGKIKEQSSASFEQLNALISAEMQAKEYLQVELDNLTLKYKEIVEKERQVSSEKAEMVKYLLAVSGIMTDSEDVYQLSSDIATLVDRCAQKIKEQSSASLDSSSINVELFETIQSHLYVTDQELMLCQNILEEEMLVKSDVNRLSEELRVVSQQVEELKEEKGSLQRDIERSEEKNAMIREKLSMAVKKGKGLFQERENLRLRVEEKNSEIEKLRVELQKEQSTLSECRDKINSLSADTECIPKLEADLVSMKEQRDQHEQLLLERNNMLQRITKSIDAIVLPVDSKFEEPLGKVNWLVGYLSECQDAEAQAKQELGKVEEERSNLAFKLEEAYSTIKSLENELSVVENSLAQLAEEKREMEIDKTTVERELQRALEEAVSQASKFSEVSAAKKSLEEALSLAENNLAVLVSEKEGAVVSRATADAELEKVKVEYDIQTSKLSDAYETIKSLEVALSQVQANVSVLTEQNNDAQISRSNLEAELKKLHEEVTLQDNKLADTSSTIKSLEEALLKAGNDISELETGKKNAEEEILTLNSKLNAASEELSGTNGSTDRSLELNSHLDNLQMLMGDKTMLSTMKRSFEKKFESLKDMNLILKNIRHHCVSAGLELQRHQVLEEDSYVTKSFSDGLLNIASIEKDNAEVNGADGDDIPSYLSSTVERLQSRDMVLSQNFDRFSSIIDEIIENLLRNLQERSDEVAAMFEHMESLKQKENNLEIEKHEQENTIAILERGLKSLVSACTDATRELQFEAKNKLLKLSSVPELEELRDNPPQETGATDGETTETQEQGIDGSKHSKTAGMLSVACKNVQALIRQFEITSGVAASTIENLQNELKEARTTSEKFIEERDLRQDRIYKLEADIEMLESSCTDLKLKLEDYQGKEDILKEREAELSSLHTRLSLKEQENEDFLLSASEVKILFDKIKGIEFPIPESEVGDVGTHHSIYVEKLFHVIDNISHFQHQINSLSREKEELQSSLGTQLLEIKHLREEVESYVRYEQDTEKMKNELSVLIYALEKIIDMSGGNDLVGDEKSAGVKGLVSVLEKQVMALLVETKNSKSKTQELGTKLVESQKLVDELSSKVNILEVSAQGRVAQPEIVQERSIFEAPSVPTGSEISEIEDVGSLGSKTISPVPSAAHVRTMRKGSTDHLAIDIDPESTRLISTEETDEDKGHVFKSLNASGIIPRQGKLIADRIDGIWVSSGRSLMSRPRARLGVIAYWLVLHLWLLGVIIL
ncbi:trans-Golgi network-localized SYP41-interacting protein 1 [Argentina anserina]|uniref:trans-Golgi network-localized SYP41-interacting protein 1 n=1 Tax=Argentina anserina TaxID=57926 RepID=UPI0021765BF0|nr:trans-Golgi network-localized SYP41-interacting protein 1 [Potentilla anserina]